MIMLEVHVYRLYNFAIITSLIVVALTPVFLELWNVYYEMNATATTRHVMRFFEDAYIFFDEVAFTILWPIPSWCFPARFRALLVLCVNVMLMIAAYDFLLRMIGGPVLWVFVMPPEDPELDEELAYCLMCNIAFKFTSQSQLPDNDDISCPFCSRYMQRVD